MVAESEAKACSFIRGELVQGSVLCWPLLHVAVRFLTNLGVGLWRTAAPAVLTPKLYPEESQLLLQDTHIIKAGGHKSLTLVPVYLYPPQFKSTSPSLLPALPSSGSGPDIEATVLQRSFNQLSQLGKVKLPL